MASIEEQLKDVRTLEDIVNLLSILFTNLNNQNEMYYDMFINPTPMWLKLERYDENGKLVTVDLKNRALDRIFALTGEGDPEGKVPAAIGSIYVDTKNETFYYKGAGNEESSSGWEMVWSTKDLKEGINFLAPNGNGSQLTNLNANRINSGVLKVENGGTGATSITGLVKGNGTSAFEAAVPNQDYLVPDEFVGLIMWSPLSEIPSGHRWLVCDGTLYNIQTRPELTNLCNRVGNKYKIDGDDFSDLTTFRVPNLIGRYCKGSTFEDVGITGEAQIGEHNHALTGSTGAGTAHSHAPGNLNVRESHFTMQASSPFDVNYTGVFSVGTKTDASTSRPGGEKDWKVHFNLGSSNWDATTKTASENEHTHTLENLQTAMAGSGENDVAHMNMVPLIRY